MKYIKEFESTSSLFWKKNEPKKGDYIIFKDYSVISTHTRNVFSHLTPKSFTEFIENNIGKIITNKSENDNYDVVYYNVPKNIEIWFNILNDHVKSATINIKNIIYWSENKEELELILKSMKYNL